MEEMIAKITEFLRKNPNSRARLICKEIGAEKKAVNSCLYSNIGKHFLKQGETPPLWRNVGDNTVSESAVGDNTSGNDVHNIDAPERN
jgi:hypothetical protein